MADKSLPQEGNAHERSAAGARAGEHPALAGTLPRLGPLQIAILLLVLATAAIHLYLAFVYMPGHTGNIDPLFLLNGLGYLGLVAALYAPLGFLHRWRPLVRWVLLGYTALTVLLWFILTQFMGTERTTLGYVDKAIEIALIVLLYLESQRAEG